MTALPIISTGRVSPRGPRAGLRHLGRRECNPAARSAALGSVAERAGRGSPLKEAMLSAFEDAGGRKWLASLGTSHPQVLAILVGKLLPQSLANDPENP